MNTKPIKLFIRDNNKAVRVWSIAVEDYEIVIRYGVLHGSTQVKTESVPEGKAGRTRREQVMSRVASRILKQRDKGYSNNIEHSRKQATNSMNTLKPMLAQPFKNVSLCPPYYLQYKYDGNRCLITKRNGEIIAYSRNGKRMESIGHILSAAAVLSEGETIDGELYSHGVPLQTLRSWISRKQAESNNLEYMCYDIISKEPYKDRLLRLRNLNLAYPIRIAGTELIEGIEGDITGRLKAARGLGYEGLIARIPSAPYEDGKRSKGLIKIKAWEDDEFMVLDVEPSADGWGILKCATAEGKTFKVSAPGTIEEKTDILYNKMDYIGKMITVEYANMTPDKIPFHPVAIAFREDYD